MVDRCLTERRISCPFCGEAIEILIDASEGSQQYIEDCQVCCQPMQVSVSASAGELESIEVDRG